MSELTQSFLSSSELQASILPLIYGRLDQIAATKNKQQAPSLAMWIHQHVTIEEPQGDAVSIIPFHLWPAQRDALALIESKPQLIILKARQLGISWLVIAYALWLCLYHDNKMVMVFSKDQDSANEMIRRAKGIYQRLQNKPAAMNIDNVTTIGWSNGSRIKSFAATEDAGSSFTASLTIIDEFAKMRYADALYTSVKPTINDGGKMIIVSTARGESNPFHTLWQAATKGANSFAPLFLPWTSRPDRTPEWYAHQEADAISSAHHRQEYPALPDEAFVSIGEDRFLQSMTLWDAYREDLPPLTEHEPLFLAIDGADTNDTFGMVGVTTHPDKSGRYAVRIVYQWTPPPGGVIDHYGEGGPDWIIRNKIAPLYSLVEVIYDPHGLEQFAYQLMRDGIIQCVRFNQQEPRLESDKFLFDSIMFGRIAHDGNEYLRQHIDNANRKPDPEGRRLRIVKRGGGELKIDLAVALSMAIYSAKKAGL